MSLELQLSIFRFDAETDYLPYYKKYKITCKSDHRLKDVLDLVKEEDPFFDFPRDKYSAAFVNGYAVDLDLDINSIYKQFGQELTISPLSQNRANKDLIIDTGDFEAVFKDISKIVDIKKDEYLQYIRYFYASAALKYDRLHQGTSLFLLADYLIKKYPEKKEDILSFIADEKHGIWYHSCLDYKVFPKNNQLENIIISLKNKILKLGLENTSNILKQSVNK
ncbi:MAG: hypothetical protein CR967_04680 [Proteobacteria bacterium]|nr:MAG: hypothetical protein CR967_04680 [Pseudomonadota bacterium]